MGMLTPAERQCIERRKHGGLQQSSVGREDRKDGSGCVLGTSLLGCQKSELDLLGNKERYEGQVKVIQGNPCDSGQSKATRGRITGLLFLFCFCFCHVNHCDWPDVIW